MIEYIKREDALNKFKRMPPSPTKEFIIETLNAIPAADVEPVGIRTTFDEEAAQTINNFIDLCEVDAEAMDGFVQDRFKTYLRALVYESVPAHLERSGSGE